MPKDQSGIFIEVTANGIDRLAFKRALEPGALVEVTLNGQKVLVTPQALLLAVRAVAENSIS